MGGGAERQGAINLADVALFRLGEVEVHPATRQLIRGDQSVTLEPRVMQVLVALAEARGAVLSRDALIARCWGGVVVGENAIQRAISRIRELAATIGGDSIELETITKVGYRLIVPGAADGHASPIPYGPLEAQRTPDERTKGGWGRRAVLLGGGALGLGLAGAIGHRQWRQGPSEEARALYHKGVDLQLSGLLAERDQVAAYFREAIRLAPDFADAWGALALIYWQMSESFDRPDRANLVARSRSAAERALALDPRNVDAQSTLLLIDRPFFGNWLAIERGGRRLLAQHPDHWYVGPMLARLMMEVGRWSEAVALFGDIDRSNRYAPLVQYGLITSLWNAGRLEDAERASERALARWPRHGAIWHARFQLLAHTGRPEAAIAFANDPLARPTEPSGVDAELNLTTARALASGAKADIDHAVALHLEKVELRPARAGNAIQYCASLGAVDKAFELCDGYYFGRGRWAASDPRPGGTPFTVVLFNALTASMRRERRFASLVEEIGLEDYWRRSGSRPDYRA